MLITRSPFFEKQPTYPMRPLRATPCSNNEMSYWTTTNCSNKFEQIWHDAIDSRPGMDGCAGYLAYPFQKGTSKMAVSVLSLRRLFIG